MLFRSGRNNNSNEKGNKISLHEVYTIDFIGEKRFK